MSRESPLVYVEHVPHVRTRAGAKPESVDLAYRDMAIVCVGRVRKRLGVETPMLDALPQVERAERLLRWLDTRGRTRDLSRPPPDWFVSRHSKHEFVYWRRGENALGSEPTQERAVQACWNEQDRRDGKTVEPLPPHKDVQALLDETHRTIGELIHMVDSLADQQAMPDSSLDWEGLTKRARMLRERIADELA